MNRLNQINRVLWLFLLVGAIASVQLFFPSATLANECSIYAYPEITEGKSWRDQGYYLVVYEGVRSDGEFEYQKQDGGRWYTATWKAVDGNANYTRFGVSTLWAYMTPFWNTYEWYYVYDC